MSADNFGALGADFFIRTFNKGSLMSQSDLDQLIQYVQLTTTIIAIGDFTPDVQQSVWMILERVDVPSATGYTVTNNTEVTMTSGGLVTIDSMPWTKITGKPTLFTANQTLNTSDSVSFNRLTVTGASGIEGGEIELAKAPNSTIAGNVIIDVYEDKLRFFEGGGNGRGFYLDLTTGANNTSTNIMSGGDSFSGSYNDLTDKPTIPTSFSSLVNGSYTASLGTDGKLTAPGNLQVDGGKIILNTAGNAYLESVDYGVNSANSAVNIFGGPYQKIKLRAGFGTEATWTFGTDGSLTLPAGGDILVDDGKIISADGEDFKIIVQDSDDNGNRLDLVVTDGTDQATRVEVDRDGVQIVTNLLDAENQRNWTFKSDGTTEFPNYTISQYSSLKIKSGASSSTAIWTFGTDGDLTAPRNIILNNPVTTVTTTVTGTVADSTGNPFTFRILKADNPQLVIPFADPNFVLKWTGSDAGSVAAGAQAPGGQGPSSLVSDDGTYWNFNSWFGLGGNRPNTGTVFTVEYGVVDSDTTISTTDTNLIIEADAKQYKFGTDGNITLPAGGDILDSTGASVLDSPDPRILTSDSPTPYVNGFPSTAESAIDLTKQLATLGDGEFTLADGVENQILYLAHKGSVRSNCFITFSNVRYYSNGTLSSNFRVAPFGSGSSQICIFTNGAWSVSFE